MTHRFAFCLALVALTTVLPRPISATVVSITTFDTVDAVEINNGPSGGSAVFLVITGILAGQSSPVTATFFFNGGATALQCERFAIIAMSKPGKYQFAVGASDASGACRLILRTP
jgi:hypothetical protein